MSKILNQFKLDLDSVLILQVILDEFINQVLIWLHLLYLMEKAKCIKSANVFFTLGSPVALYFFLSQVSLFFAPKDEWNLLLVTLSALALRAYALLALSTSFGSEGNILSLPLCSIKNKYHPFHYIRLKNIIMTTILKSIFVYLTTEIVKNWLCSLLFYRSLC